ncbi:hypothetical protein AT6N2_C2576 [Agrobacterium tumefaciens]|nr:hypothetical protein AT6N2_C2576 [Agrobacterium tumefaciens]
MSLYGFGSGFFAEAVGDKRLKRRQRLFRLIAACLDIDAAAGACRQHHQAHDGGAANRHTVLGYGDCRVETLDHLHEFCGRTSVQATFIDDR